MKLAIISFTEAGSRLCQKLVQKFREQGDECAGYIQERYMASFENASVSGLMPVDTTLSEWTENQFSEAEGIIYIGACGIAVRAIAPFLKDKFTDPAVVVIDECGHFSVPLLSGHVGGANELALRAADMCGAAAVVTTATDIEGKFSVDVFAVENKLWICDRQLAKRVSAELLDGKPVGFYSDFHLAGGIPEGFTQKRSCRYHVWITVRENPAPDAMIQLFLQEDSEILRLVPKALCVGIGCRRGTKKEQILQAVTEVFERYGLSLQAADMASSIDLKQNEEGLLAFAKEMGWNIQTFDAKELEKVQGIFSSSGFVREVTGVDNVCERAAMAAAGCHAALAVPKQVVNHVTVAVACRNMEYNV